MDMKRIIAILLCLSMLLAGCGKKTEEPTAAPVATAPATTQAPTEEVPTEPAETEPPAPETVAGMALADRSYVVLKMLERGETVDIVGEYDEEFYIVQTQEGYGLMEKRLVRPEGEAEYETWTGYATYNALVYDNYHLLPGNEQKLNLNTQVQLLDSLGDCLVVQLEDSVGYMLESQVSRYYIQSAPAGGGNTGGADGGDISLGYYGGFYGLSSFIPQEGEVTCAGTVLASDAEVILGWFDREDAMAIVTQEGYAEAKEGWVIVYNDGKCGYVRENLVLQDGQEAYAQWDGFAQYQAAVYDNYYLRGEPTSKLTANANVKVLCDLGNCYMISVDDAIGYAAKDQISATYIVYGGGGGGESSGGDWTPPAM